MTVSLHSLVSGHWPQAAELWQVHSVTISIYTDHLSETMRPTYKVSITSL